MNVEHHLRHPVASLRDLATRARPQRAFDAHARQAAAIGLDRLYLIVSFDCDTERDIEVVGEVHRRMLELGVMPAYAVAGELLRLGAAEYGAIAASGAEVLNHGGRAHARWDAATQTVESTFFYDQASWREVEQDIRDGHAAVTEVTGRAPDGFRTPHFGSFADASSVRRLHELLRSMGYRWSSSTLPDLSYRDGPVSTRFPLPEIPVSGMGSRPHTLLDSWSFLFAPDRRWDHVDYVREAALAASRAAEAGPGLLNYYADPMHVAGSEAFFDAVASWCAVATPTTFGELVERVT